MEDSNSIHDIFSRNSWSFNDKRPWAGSEILPLHLDCNQQAGDLRVDGHAFDGGVGVEHGFADCRVGVDGEHQFVDGSF
jgi:hypothetical protein